ncbi:MAG: hypothetical protein IPM67_01415 [Sphingomonadales bacterium]|nr:hypothetical protein [Sphingomonadales bacterium]MBK9267336.1 hypothetical protein [Sphingomonadales bacterium]MBP6434691.1 hypothetical protein [Sphingorhabdus sp.]
MKIVEIVRMAPLKERKLRFSGVVYAVDASPKALRKWLQREQVDLITPRTEGGWNYFSMGDVAVLALVRSIVNFGVGVETASRLARCILLEIQGEHWFDPAIAANEQPASGWMFWTNRAVLIFPDERGEHWDMKVWNMWQAFPQDAPAAALIIKPEEVLRRALERAADNADWTDDSTPQFLSENILAPIGDNSSRRDASVESEAAERTDR